MSLALVLAACGGEDDTTTEAGPTEDAATEPAPEETDDGAFDSVVGQAEEEGRVVLYTSMTPQQIESIAEAFEAQYPSIEADFIRGTNAEMHTRFETEQDAGIESADVLITTDVTWWREHEAEFVAATSPRLDEAPWNEHHGPGNTVNVAYDTFGFVWNTEHVDEPLEDWEDFLRPELRGRIGLWEMSSPVSGGFYTGLVETYGDDFLERLAEQEPRFYPSLVPGVEALGAGEIWALIAANQPAVSGMHSGLPIEVAYAEPHVGYGFHAGVLESASHPAAGQLLIDFLLSTEGQEATVIYLASPLDGISRSTGLPEGMTLIDAAEWPEGYFDDFRAQFDATFAR
jgi:iron(III) transport system substrate-binding protein